MIPLFHANKTSISWNSWSFFTISMCIEPQDIEMFRVFCANRTSRYCFFCFFLDLFLEFSCLSKNDLNTETSHLKRWWFRQSWGICPAQSPRITAPQRLNRAAVICGCSSRALVIRGRFRQIDSLLKCHAKGEELWIYKPQAPSGRRSQNC